MPRDWTEAYAAMHGDGAAEFPPACLHYVLDLVRHAARRGSAAPPLSPADTVAAFRRAVALDFGPLRGAVMEDWALRTPGDLGRAVNLLARYGCLSLDPGDAPEAFAADSVPFIAASEASR